jgi:5-hydroxyisourate hydrolase-like protein (transthyretin family)
LSARLIFLVTLLSAIGLAAQTAAPVKPLTGYPIAGVVVSSAAGQPLSGIAVSITSTENRHETQTVQTRADGRFAFTGLPAGKYSLTASARGYRAQGFNQHSNFFTGIAVGPDLDASNLTFRLVPDAAIEGIVTDDDGDPVRNASVQLFERNNDSGQQRIQPLSNSGTDDRGYYRFGHLASGTYFVAVSARPWYAQYSSQQQKQSDSDNARLTEEKAQLDVAYPMTFYPAAEDSSAASAIGLHPGEQASADVVMRAVPAAHLRIKRGGDNSGGDGPQGMPRVSQRVFDGTLVPVMSLQGFGDPSGAFEYTGIAPGHYVIEMSYYGQGRRLSGWYKEVDLSGTTDLDPRESPPLASVSGALLIESAIRPPGKMYVILTDRISRENFSAEVSNKGLFDFKDDEIRPGRYEVVLANAPGFQIKSMIAKGAKTVGQTIEISGGSVQLVCTATHAVAKVTGVVLRDDKPFAGAMVVLVPRSPESNWTLFRRDQSDSDGTFNLPEVLPGPYTAIALQDAWELDWASPAVLQPYLKNGTPVEVTGEGTISVKVQLQ